MINPDAPTEILPGFLRGDLQYLAECLEGVHGEGRRAEAAPRSAAFIRAALAHPLIPKARLLRPLPYDDLARIAGIAPGEVTVVLTDAEHRMILKQRAHAERNRGDEEEDHG